MTQKLLAAIRLIHAHHEATFHERVFAALDLLFPHSRYALEMFGSDGSHHLETNLPFQECGGREFYDRTNELVQSQSPMFQRLSEGERSPMRLSDHISMRQLKNLDLYHEIFTGLHIRHQIGIPIESSFVLGGLTINRDQIDYSNEEVHLASMIAPQIATAFEVDQMMRRLKVDSEKANSVDFNHLRRLGLTRRESEVMYWLVEAKRDIEIACILGLSVRTVRQHVRAILGKLRVENRTAAVAMICRRDIPPMFHSFSS